MSDTEFPGRVGRTVAESEPWWPAPRERDAIRPNVVLIILDDTGFSDLGCFGSEIRTPHIDRLAEEGLRYSDFSVTPLCSPTRASLLTGRNHHSVGMRFLSDLDTGFENSRGRIPADVPMLPAILRDNGYGTFLVGKWHLTPAHEITPAGPFESWPLSRGFDRFYGFLDGCTDQYTPELYEDNHQAEPVSRDGYHLSEDLVDRSIDYVTQHLTYRREDPFFLQLALGATHAPFQAPAEYIEPYRDVFAKGWDRTRSDRLERQIAMGLVPEGTALNPRNPGVPAWDELSVQEQDFFVRLQAVFAGFLEHADAQIGRLLDRLDALGLTENTVVMVLSDNGASREGQDLGGVDTNVVYSRLPYGLEAQRERVGELGGPSAGAHYPEGWAMAGNTPFQYWKQFVDLGGVRSPLVVRWPSGIPAAGEVRRQFSHAVDIAPTLLELACVDADPQMHGRSMTATFASASAPDPRETHYWEMFGHRAIRHGRWRAVTAHVEGEPLTSAEWRLYHSAEDFSESVDLAADHPAKVEELDALWWREAERNDVFPIDDRSMGHLLNTGVGQVPGIGGADRFVLYPRSGHLPSGMKASGLRRSMRMTAHLRDWNRTHEGVLLACGTTFGGYVLYVQDGEAVFEHTALGVRTAVRIALDETVPVRVVLEVRKRPDHSAAVSLRQDGADVARDTVPFSFGHLSYWGTDVGRDRGRQVSAAYEGEFPFPESVFELLEVEALGAVDPVEEAELAMRTS
ncbi:arylsulfatase [Streptomyces sp. MS2A]|nr:arylsulfatase [Streptomyces sp. MS2A]